LTSSPTILPTNTIGSFIRYFQLLFSELHSIGMTPKV
jgi:hypothetical protein